ncbi:MAG: aldose epimerase family protein [Termitinemataceae bacterium]
MRISKKVFGTLSNGDEVFIYTLKIEDIEFSLSSYGASWLSLILPSRKESPSDVLLGYSTLTGYTHNPAFMGVTVGRFANRISNGRFTLEGRTYMLHQNDGKNTLHGGRRGFDKCNWKSEAYEDSRGLHVRFELFSPDGDEGFPGNLKAIVTYSLNEQHQILCDYQATVDTLCPINLTNHAYFNLQGEGSGSILDHELMLYASQVVKSNETLIPTGELRPVVNTAFDFTSSKPIGKDIAKVSGGYDHCYVVDGSIGSLRPCAMVLEPQSGRTMNVFTTQPGVQFYSGNFLNGIAGKDGSIYHQHGGFCLETQHFPDTPNRTEFPSCIYGPGSIYHEQAIFSFEW